MTTPRGVRNNNPGNIDYNPRNAWQGQLGIEVDVAKPRFARFDTPENGIRALGKLLINYRGKDGMPGVGGKGIDTVLETINRWAPSNENDTQAYARAVSTRIGVRPTDVINIKDPAVLRGMVVGIIVHENGGNPYPSALIDEGIRRALA
ncbi:structural protein P5 [Pseudomonas fulva]|uniref:structural protein P5 n=1 Tax=Pseudomonas TaxID=286 RepID=UPI0018AC8B6F|nr:MULTISPECIES: structural protein P5 [Pseudomonas]MBF8674800.1 structural protein P5 [Pseudomonas fulva]MBF8696641.1 structural protein P5 [Pseudomonas fulva]MBH3342437.1 structural protein P5 [Pseudomonas parafulva]